MVTMIRGPPGLCKQHRRKSALRVSTTATRKEQIYGSRSRLIPLVDCLEWLLFESLSAGWIHGCAPDNDHCT